MIHCDGERSDSAARMLCLSSLIKRKRRERLWTMRSESGGARKKREKNAKNSHFLIETQFEPIQNRLAFVRVRVCDERRFLSSRRSPPTAIGGEQFGEVCVVHNDTQRNAHSHAPPPAEDEPNAGSPQDETRSLLPLADSVQRNTDEQLRCQKC